MNIKYQIFISSTYVDLVDERDQVIKVILEMGHFPVGMEMFSAGDDEQWKYIAKRIDESDYYVVIVAHRYGSLSGKISYTEKEYDYAVKKGVPVLGFIIDDSAQWSGKYVDKGQSSIKSLNDFKAKIKTKSHKLWKNADDLSGKVGISITKQIQDNPRIGWIRTSEAQETKPPKPISSSPKKKVINLQTRINRIFAILDDPIEVESEFNGIVEWNNNETTRLPTEFGPFTLYYVFDDDGNILQYIYVALLDEAFDQNELFANIRILLKSILEIYENDPLAICKFIIVSNEDLNPTKESLTQRFIKMLKLIKHPLPGATTLEIWDKSFLIAKEKELGLIIED
jgi:hypothetical protein